MAGAMALATLIPLILKASIALTVFALGLSARPGDALYLLRRPALLVRALIAMNVVMPVVAAVAAAAFQFHPAVEVGLIALAVSPIPPLLPKKGLKTGADAAYTFGLLVTMGVLAIGFVPVAVDVLGRAFGKSVYVSPIRIAGVVFATVLIPLAAGMAVRRLLPTLAARIAGPASLVATVLLLAGALPVLFTAWPAMMALIGNGTLLALVAFVGIGLATGQALGGPSPEEKTVLALCTACRHPGVAMALTSEVFAEQKQVVAVVLLYLVVAGILTSLYLVWRRRHPGMVPAVGA